MKASFNRRTFLGAVSSLALARTGLAQDARWPTKPITIVVPSAAGGAADFTARTFGNFITKVIPTATVVVDDKPGAGGIVGTMAVKTAPADGYTYLISTNSTHAANVSLFSKLDYDPQRDFEPVGVFGTFGTVLMVNASSPHKTLPQLIQFAKSNPNKLSFGYYSSSSRVPAELLKARAQINCTAVSYKNITQIVTDLLGGFIDFAFMDMLSAAPALQNARLLPLAVSASKREVTLPQVATVADTLPGFEVQGWIGLHAPAGSPKPALARVEQLIQQAMANEDVHKALESRGMSVSYMSAEAMRTYVKEDVVRWAEWVKLAGIQPQ